MSSFGIKCFGQNTIPERTTTRHPRSLEGAGATLPESLKLSGKVLTFPIHPLIVVKLVAATKSV